MSGNRENEIVQVCAKITLSQRNLLNAKAKSAGMTAKQFLQMLILNAQVIAAPPGIADEIRKTNGWLGRINGNINMLSKWANVHRERVFADLILIRLALIHKDLTQITSFTGDLRAQGFGKRKRKKGEGA
ncbi:MAG: hypothetical protein ACI8TV_000604 [Porticoccaceae bacterium]|jgi:hypothetical protein